MMLRHGHVVCCDLLGKSLGLLQQRGRIGEHSASERVLKFTLAFGRLARLGRRWEIGPHRTLSRPPLPHSGRSKSILETRSQAADSRRRERARSASARTRGSASLTSSASFSTAQEARWPCRRSAPAAFRRTTGSTSCNRWTSLAIRRSVESDISHTQNRATEDLHHVSSAQATVFLQPTLPRTRLTLTIHVIGRPYQANRLYAGTSVADYGYSRGTVCVWPTGGLRRYGMALATSVRPTMNNPDQ